MSRIALVFEKFDGSNPVLSILTSRVEKLGIEYLRAVLEAKGHSVWLIDNELERIPAEALAARLNAEPLDIIGLSVNAGNLDSSLALARLIAPGPFLVMGGVLPSLHGREILETLPRVDGVVLGEGEIPLQELASWADDRSSALPEIPSCLTRLHPHPPLAGPYDLNALPILRHPLLDRYDQAAVSTSRGCRYACAFCAESRFLREAGAGWHGRDPGHVVEELIHIRRSSGANSVWIVDGDFIGPSPGRAASICREILRERLEIYFEIDARVDDVDRDLFSLLKKAGLRRVFLGVESLSEKFLMRMRKRTAPEDALRALGVLKTLGISYTLGLIPFSEETTYEELARDAAFLEEYGFENCGSHLFMGLKDYRAMKTEIPRNFRDERVARIFQAGREFEKRLNWCYAGHVREPLAPAERPGLVREINQAVGNELLALIKMNA